MQTMNSDILKRAEESLGFWDEESLWARLIERDISAEDMEALEFHLKESENEMQMMQSAENIVKDFNLFVLGEGDEPIILANLPRVSLPTGFGGEEDE